ncbi:MAG: ribonuclease P protein component [Nitrospirota bacterium]
MRSLTGKRDFESVLKEGWSFASRNIVMYARANSVAYNRLGLSVSKKLGGSVKRNRIKRLLREVMTRLSRELPQNYDFVIIARKASLKAGFEDFIYDVRKLLASMKEMGKMSCSEHSEVDRGNSPSQYKKRISCEKNSHTID